VFSAALAAALAQGAEPMDAMLQAKLFISRAIEQAVQIGRGAWVTRR
jgi:hydroxymethylpyrimidine/phosphomethylpyrimidine kinase